MLVQKIQGENQKLLTPYIFHFLFLKKMVTHISFYKIHCFISFSLCLLLQSFTSLHYHIPPINFSSSASLPSPFFIYHLDTFSLMQPFPFHSSISHNLFSVLHSAVVSTFCSCSRSVANPVLQPI